MPCLLRYSVISVRELGKPLQLHHRRTPLRGCLPLPLQLPPLSLRNPRRENRPEDRVWAEKSTCCFFLACGTLSKVYSQWKLVFCTGAPLQLSSVSAGLQGESLTQKIGSEWGSAGWMNRFEGSLMRKNYVALYVYSYLKISVTCSASACKSPIWGFTLEQRRSVTSTKCKVFMFSTKLEVTKHRKLSKFLCAVKRKSLIGSLFHTNKTYVLYIPSLSCAVNPSSPVAGTHKVFF